MNEVQRNRIIEEGARLLMEAEVSGSQNPSAFMLWMAGNPEHLREVLEQAHLRARLRKLTAEQWARSLRYQRVRTRVHMRVRSRT